jgi:hypothetical protein
MAQYTDMKIVQAVLLLMLLTLPTHGQLNLPSSPEEAKVAVDAVVQRCLSRDFTTLENGITRISWVNPTDEDYGKIQGLGHSAVDPLATHIESRNDFDQLLAVKFLGSLRVSGTTKPLETATASRNWVIVRLAAMTELWSTATDEGRSWIMNMRNDPDPLVSKRATDLVDSSTPR